MILVASMVAWRLFPDISNRPVILLMVSIANASQGCGGVCAQAGCHHRQQSVLQRGLQAGEHQPSQQVCPAVLTVCVCVVYEFKPIISCSFSWLPLIMCVQLRLTTSHSISVTL